MWQMLNVQTILYIYIYIQYIFKYFTIDRTVLRFDKFHTDQNSNKIPLFAKQTMCDDPMNIFMQNLIYILALTIELAVPDENNEDDCQMDLEAYAYKRSYSDSYISKSRDLRMK